MSLRIKELPPEHSHTLKQLPPRSPCHVSYIGGHIVILFPPQCTRSNSTSHYCLRLLPWGHTITISMSFLFSAMFLSVWFPLKTCTFSGMFLLPVSLSSLLLSACPLHSTPTAFMSSSPCCSSLAPQITIASFPFTIFISFACPSDCQMCYGSSSLFPAVEL